MKTKCNVLSLIPYFLFILLAFIALVIAGCSLIFVTSFLTSMSLFFLFLSMSFLLMFFGGGLEITNVKVNSDGLVFRQIFGLRSNQYSFSEITGFKSAILKNKNGEYTYLLIRTNTEKVIEISGAFISNISEVENELTKTLRYDSLIKEPIINLKDKLFIIFTILFMICFLWFIISLL